jgi:hypothetical protein
MCNRNSPTTCPSPIRSAEILNTDETYRNVKRSNDPQPTTHQNPSAPGNKNTSFVTDSISQRNEQWSSGVEREREVDPLYVHTAQSFQDPTQESPPGMQNSEWACSVQNFNNPYTGDHSSPSRSFRSLYSPAIAYNGFHSFSPEFPMNDLWARPKENPHPASPWKLGSKWNIPWQSPLNHPGNAIGLCGWIDNRLNE